MMNPNEFCDADSGFDYIFTRMNAIYGGGFARHWDGVDMATVRIEWKRQLGNYLTYRPSMDYAIDRLKGEFPPSAITFREFCNAGPDLPRDEKQIEYKPTPVDPKVVEDAKRRLAELRGKPWTNKT
jgi:hypothetical protein